jgi:hypothetical protein
MTPWTLLSSKARLMQAKGGRRREGRLVQYQGAMEALEYRVVLSTTMTGSTEGGAPSLQDFGLPSLVDVPVSADLQVSRAVEELFGGPPPFSMIVPLPQFITPAGTSTVTTSWTGPITFTNFQIDSEQLNQLASNITLPDGGSPYVSPYLQAIDIQTTSAFDLIHFILEPITLDLLGVNVVMSGVDMTMGFQDAPGSPSWTGDVAASAISIVSRALDLFASGLGLVARKAQEIAAGFALPAGLSGVLQQVAPPAGETIPITQYQVPATASDSQTFTVSIARGAMVNVSATTGPAELLGNLLAEALYLENSGYANLKAVLARYLSDLLPRLPVEFQREVLFSVPFEGLIPDRSVTYAYEAQVGSYVPTGSTEDPLIFEVQVSSFAAPGQAGVQVFVVDQSGATAVDARGQRPPAGVVFTIPQGGPDGSAGAEGGDNTQGENGPGSQGNGKDDVSRYLLMIFPGLAPFHQRALYGFSWYFGFPGVSQGAWGGARIQLKKQANTEQPKVETTPPSWDREPLPRVLPDLGLDDDDGDPRRSKPTGTGEAAWLGAPGPWGEGFTARILLLTSVIPGIGYSVTFTGQDPRSDHDGLCAGPGAPSRGAHGRRTRFSSEGGPRRRAWRTAIRPWSWK